MNYKRKQAPPENLVGPRVSFLSRLIRCRFNEVIAQEGLYSGQQDIIFALIENEGITSSKLASSCGVSLPTMSVSIKRMEKAGFILKKPAVPKNIKAKMDELEAVITKGMDKDTALKFAHYLQTAIDNLLEECGDCREKGDESEC